MERDIQIAQMTVSAEPDDTLVAAGVGSGIGLAVYDPHTRVGGMLHFILPDSALEKEIARQNPFMFADTGLTALFEALSEIGGLRERVKVMACGGAEIMGQTGDHNIGKLNSAALKKWLVREKIRLDVLDTGGHVNRSLKLDIATGDLFVRRSGDAGEVKR